MRDFFRWLGRSDKHPYETVVMLVSALCGVSVWTLPRVAPALENRVLVLVWGTLLALGALTNIAGWVLTYRRLVIDGAVLEQVGMALAGFCLTVYGVAMFANRPLGQALVVGSLVLGFGLGSYIQVWKVARHARRLNRRLDEQGA